MWHLKKIKKHIIKVSPNATDFHQDEYVLERSAEERRLQRPNRFRDMVEGKRVLEGGGAGVLKTTL